MPQRDVPIDD